jgi:hypothetical protein
MLELFNKWMALPGRAHLKNAFEPRYRKYPLGHAPAKGKSFEPVEIVLSQEVIDDTAILENIWVHDIVARLPVIEMINPVYARVPYRRQRVWARRFDTANKRARSAEAVYIMAEYLGYSVERL